MESEDILEKAFRQEIRHYKLKFKDEQLESEYSNYRTNEKHVPIWTTWLITSLIVLLIARRVQVVLLFYYAPGATFALPEVEFICIAMVVAAGILDIIAVYWKRVTIIRGLPLLIGLFLSVSYNSHKYYSESVVITTTYFGKFP